ncbi:hypothetical protein EZS27_030210 [termite gut metagenome]|uniref:Glycosyl transferase CAP10 domain-containing protein n=1 Tax=termite gut metagenome TaxID=433724 RepID=A0A5J4QEI8_9ZZZZ
MVNIIRFINLRKHKNSKFIYYLKNLIRYYTPKIFLRKKFSCILAQLSKQNEKHILDRVNYYNKLDKVISVSNKMIPLLEFKRPKKKKGQSANSSYFFDSYQYTRYFSNSLKVAFLFGDVMHVPEIPSITKSRPINGNNINSVILNLDKVRHFMFIKDHRVFRNKKDMLVGRAYVAQPHRIRFWEMYFNHPLCNLGQINTIHTAHPEWITKPMSINEHLKYKFILCIEGNDVATNLKWVMSSNSLAVMPQPHYETWFMEGRLIPNYHYVEIKADYSDLEDRLTYYMHHVDEAMQIIENAHQYIAQFRDKKREDFISLLTLQKYFQQTGQLR